MPIHAPRAQHALHVAIVARSPDVVHHLVAAIFHNSGANRTGEGVQRLVPGRALPFALSALASALQGIENALRVVDLVDGRRAFGAVAPATAGVVGIAFELFDTPALFVHVGQQTAGSLAVKTNRRDQLVAAFHLARPGPRIVLHPVLPAFRRRTRSQVAHRHLFSTGRDMLL